MTSNRIASAIFAVLLVTAGVAGPMAQPVAADEADDCAPLDNFLAFASFGAWDAAECAYEAYTQDAIADYQETDAEQTKVDIYAESEQLRQGSENFRSPFANNLEDTESVAWSKMQVAVAEAYENDSTEAQARYEAEKAIEEYYAVKQRNLLAQWNTHTTGLMRLRHQAEMEDGVSGSFVQGYHGSQDNYYEIADMGNQTVPLVNGTDARSNLLQGTDSQAISVRGSEGTGFWQEIRVDPPTSEFDSHSTAMRPGNYRSLWTQIQSQNDALASEAKTFVNATYSDFDSGEANASDVIDANTAMFEYGTQTGDNRTLWSSTASLAMMGFDTPDLNSSGTMDVAYDNSTYTGIVMARNAPNGSWEANTTYNSSNITGPVFILTTEGTKVDFSGEFTIETMRAKDGTDVETVNTTEYAYKTANASEMMEMQQELTSLRQEIEEREPSGGGGGGSGGMSQNAMLTLLAVAAAAALVYGRQNGGNGGGRRGRR